MGFYTHLPDQWVEKFMLHSHEMPLQVHVAKEWGGQGCRIGRYVAQMQLASSFFFLLFFENDDSYDAALRGRDADQRVRPDVICIGKRDNRII